MNINEIYQRYHIMPQLQLHQLRVAAVAQHLAHNVNQELDINSIVTACLLHDMGNIIKFDLQHMAFPQFLQPQGKKFWLQIQQQYLDQYGDDEHQATMQIAQELSVSAYILELIDSIGFGNLAQNYERKNLAKMICEYADNRVTPLGIASLEARLQDLTDRYSHRFSSPEQIQFRKNAQKFARLSEQYIFMQTQLQPPDITDQALDGTITKLKDFSW